MFRKDALTKEILKEVKKIKKEETGFAGRQEKLIHKYKEIYSEDYKYEDLIKRKNYIKRGPANFFNIFLNLVIAMTVSAMWHVAPNTENPIIVGVIFVLSLIFSVIIAWLISPVVKDVYYSSNVYNTNELEIKIIDGIIATRFRYEELTNEIIKKSNNKRKIVTTVSKVNKKK